MTSYNHMARTVALAQGVLIGSPEWIEGGLHPYSGQTGGHPAYGWRRPEPMTPSRARAVISNYAARPVYYDPGQHPDRHSGYNNGGRPSDWKPEAPSDLPGGESGFLNEHGFFAVSGPDVAHFWIDPLLDVIDRGAGIDIELGLGDGKTMDAAALAKVMAKSLMDALSGMLRFHGRYWSGRGRIAARLIDAHVQGFRRGVVSNENLTVFLNYCHSTILPALDQAPGVEEPKNQGSFNVYQDLSWMLPALYDLRQSMEKSPNGMDGMLEWLDRQIYRHARWILDIHQVAGGKGAWSSVDILDAMRKGEGDGDTLETLAGVISKGNVNGPEWYQHWAVRAADIVRSLEIDGAEEYFAAVVSSPNLAERKWYVDRDRNWLMNDRGEII